MDSPKFPIVSFKLPWLFLISNPVEPVHHAYYRMYPEVYVQPKREIPQQLRLSDYSRKPYKRCRSAIVVIRNRHLYLTIHKISYHVLCFEPKILQGVHFPVKIIFPWLFTFFSKCPNFSSFSSKFPHFSRFFPVCLNSLTFPVFQLSGHPET